MLEACLYAGARTLAMGAAAFTLSWTHSVEKTQWSESWRLTPDGLSIDMARVKGSGAGMDPGEGARLEGGWWVWQPALAPLDRLVLANSGSTDSRWRICGGGSCRDIAPAAGETVTIAACR